MGTIRRLFVLTSALIALTSCGPWLPEREPDFVSKCGAHVFGTSDEEGYNVAESTALFAIEWTYGWNASYTCILMHGREVEILRTGEKGPGHFHDSTYNRNVAGLAYCPRGVLIGNDDWTNNALAHEFVHLLDDCRVNLEMQCAVKDNACNYLRDHPELDRFHDVEELYWNMMRDLEQ